MKTVKFLMLLALTALLSACGNAVDTVKNGYLQGLEQTTVGNAFDAYFENPKWVLKEQANKTQIVEFSGEKTKEGMFKNTQHHESYVVQFVIKNDGTFTIVDPVAVVDEFIEEGKKTGEENKRMAVASLLPKVFKN